jgi:hypothetical protein
VLRVDCYSEGAHVWVCFWVGRGIMGRACPIDLRIFAPRFAYVCVYFRVRRQRIMNLLYFNSIVLRNVVICAGDVWCVLF